MLFCAVFSRNLLFLHPWLPSFFINVFHKCCKSSPISFWKWGTLTKWSFVLFWSFMALYLLAFFFSSAVSFKWPLKTQPNKASLNFSSSSTWSFVIFFGFYFSCTVEKTFNLLLNVTTSNVWPTNITYYSRYCMSSTISICTMLF